MSSKITVIAPEITDTEKRELHKAFRNGCGRRRMNIDAPDTKIREWEENGWIERRIDQPVLYYELKVF